LFPSFPFAKGNQGASDEGEWGVEFFLDGRAEFDPPRRKGGLSRDADNHREGCEGFR